MLGVRRPSLVRQMAFRQDSKEYNVSPFQTDLSVRHSHLAPPTVPPDSPRPQKDASSEIIGPSMMVTMKVPDTKKENNVVRLESIQLEEKRK
ncbi:hypothetical protein NECAME_07026 [Necator americanus]|uniref:Uncharacterized protein n=1 Tax=Necator americanus TaxID=51031 RepID=W2TSW1_NECAM|nr:hypothetical protein NECAME_07026 [Necator americanus]ETN84142.1 hypothetical protein NECAME_07026 [Necator americanus]